jgi:transcriptional regulator with AAA-type ATPase domain
VRGCAVVAVALIAAGGCGGGDDRLSRDEYVKQADAICAKYQKRLDALPEPENVQELKELVDEGLPIAREGYQELKALEPPEELEADVSEWFERNDRNLELIEELGQAAEEGDEQRIQSLASEAEKNEEEADRIATGIGLDVCAEEG